MCWPHLGAQTRCDPSELINRRIHRVVFSKDWNSLKMAAMRTEMGRTKRRAKKGEKTQKKRKSGKDELRLTSGLKWIHRIESCGLMGAKNGGISTDAWSPLEVTSWILLQGSGEAAAQKKSSSQHFLDTVSTAYRLISPYHQFPLPPYQSSFITNFQLIFSLEFGICKQAGKTQHNSKNSHPGDALRHQLHAMI